MRQLKETTENGNLVWEPSQLEFYVYSSKQEIPYF